MCVYIKIYIRVYSYTFYIVQCFSQLKVKKKNKNNKQKKLRKTRMSLEELKNIPPLICSVRPSFSNLVSSHCGWKCLMKAFFLWVLDISRLVFLHTTFFLVQRSGGAWFFSFWWTREPVLCWGQPWQNTAVWGGPPATGGEGSVPGPVGSTPHTGTGPSPHPLWVSSAGLPLQLSWRTVLWTVTNREILARKVTSWAGCWKSPII